MINVMNPSKEEEKYLDPQLWHACAGGMVQMPAVNSKVLYFPQGHLEHGQVNITDLKNYPIANLPALIPCRVDNVKFLADQKTDDVYAKITLIPFRGNDAEFSDDGFVGGNIGNDQTESCDNNKPASFAKTLTQSDANNGGGFSVPRYCAETIFPKLDYNATPPVQTILATDVHGVTWKFRHIYRGTPRRHLLTTGWSNFVNQKKLVAGDSIVFLRGENGELYVGIRRPKNGIGGGTDCLSGWNNASCGGSSYPGFYRDDEANKMMVRNFNGLGSKVARIKGETVLEAFNLAAKGKPFEVVYYPRSSTPEFFIKASAVKAAMQVQWCAGMRFKMPFETEDSSRISWFMGTVSSVQVTDPVRWPNSPWRLLQVAWDEPELLQNVKRVNPWLVELVANMQPMYMSPLSPPRKKLRLPQSPDFPFGDQLSMPTFPNSSFGPCRPMFGLPNTVHASIIQGARHSQFGNFMLDLHLNKVDSNPCQFTTGNFSEKPHQIRENQPSFLTMATSEENVTKNSTSTKVPFMLFGKPILTEKQMSETSTDSTRSTLSETNIQKMGVLSDSLSEVGFPGHDDHHETKLGLAIGPCNNVMDSEDFGRSLSLSTLGSYEEFYKKLQQHVWHGKVRETEQCAL